MLIFCLVAALSVAAGRGGVAVQRPDQGRAVEADAENTVVTAVLEHGWLASTGRERQEVVPGANRDGNGIVVDVEIAEDGGV